MTFWKFSVLTEIAGAGIDGDEYRAALFDEYGHRFHNEIVEMVGSYSKIPTEIQRQEAVEILKGRGIELSEKNIERAANYLAQIRANRAAKQEAVRLRGEAGFVELYALDGDVGYHDMGGSESVEVVEVIYRVDREGIRSLIDVCGDYKKFPLFIGEGMGTAEVLDAIDADDRYCVVWAEEVERAEPA